MKSLDQIIEQRGSGFLMDVYMFLNELSANHIPVNNFINWIEIDRQIRHKLTSEMHGAEKKWMRAYYEKAPDCSVCGSKLHLEQINNSPRRMVDDHSHSWWVCSDKECEMDPILTDKRTEEILADLKITPFEVELVSEARIARRRTKALQALAKGRGPQKIKRRK